MVILRACVRVAVAKFLWSVTDLTKDESPHTGAENKKFYPLSGVFYSP